MGSPFDGSCRRYYGLTVVVCAAIWSHKASGDGMVYRVCKWTLSWRPSCRGGMGSLFGGHCRQHNSYRTSSSDFSCQFVLFLSTFRFLFFCVLNMAWRCNDDWLQTSMLTLRDYCMCSPLARVPYVVFFDLKPLNEDSNLQLCKFCMHAQKGAPKIHFRPCKISLGSCLQAPHAQGLPRHLDTSFVNYATDPGAYYRTQFPLELLAGQHW